MAIPRLWPVLARIEHRKARSGVETRCWRRGNLRLSPFKIGPLDQDHHGLLGV